ncbi:wall-associated receptor kinase 4-like [Triticum dicoccoides]|uniref:wall-associated receptor kinase 4-like n=1 Tax=Triticum dicoccoides TaxID=85692 RepID=UPI00188F3075|nr:wall-associated receptor kinase 4-like [Triticum dicoccoides]
MLRTFQLLLVLALVGIVRVSGSRAHKNVTHGPHSCSGVDVPYPFGIVEDGGGGDYRAGFHVMCDAGEPVLHTTGGDGKPVKIGNFSIQAAEARVWLPVVWQCYDSSGKPSRSDYRNLEFNKGGVYRISNAKNNLFVLGCKTTGYLASQPDQGSGESTSYAQFTGCLCYCNNSQSAVNGACSGVGCCHVDIPPDLTDNWVAFMSYDHTDKVNFSPCDYAFVAEKKHYTFNTTDLKRALRQNTWGWEMPVVLDWAIRDSPTCKEARKEGYACISSNSLCLNSTNGPGYICNCRRGYEGNPYIADGCTDINECEHLDHYSCKGVCTNRQGSYECTCPKHTHSADPYKEVCSPNFPTNAKIIVGAIGGLLVMVIMVFFWLLIEEKRKMKEHFEKNGGPTLEKLNNIKLFKKEDIRKIQKSSNIIGSGGFGKVYKGCIGDNNELVAVKEPINVNSANKGQFANEIIIRSRVIHRNIVKLVGCCLQVEVPILVYEFVPNGSLHDILHNGSRMHLDMCKRLKIAAESAEGLAYMHSKTTTTILHGDVKPANILLNDEFTPKISDFGISRLIVTDMQHTGNVIGDMSYMDPVLLQTGLLTKKSDVYSFGVVLLELITRKKASHSDNNSLLRNFLDAYTKDKSVIELVDKELAEVDREILDNLGEMIMQCLNLDVNERPEMTDVAERLRDMVKRFNAQ